MTQATRKSNWGKGIFILYGGFVLFILSLVFFASQQDMDLVEKDYYQKEMEYQNQIERNRRTQQLPREVGVQYDAELQTLNVNLPPESLAPTTKGQIKLYRPSSADLDMIFEVKPDNEGHQVVDVGRPARGLWHVRIAWGEGDKEYYSQKTIIIP